MLVGKAFRITVATNVPSIEPPHRSHYGIIQQWQKACKWQAFSQYQAINFKFYIC